MIDINKANENILLTKDIFDKGRELQAQAIKEDAWQLEDSVLIWNHGVGYFPPFSGKTTMRKASKRDGLNTIDTDDFGYWYTDLPDVLLQLDYNRLYHYVFTNRPKMPYVLAAMPSGDLLNSWLVDSRRKDTHLLDARKDFWDSCEKYAKPGVPIFIYDDVDYDGKYIFHIERILIKE